jgi:hypothetical protein
VSAADPARIDLDAPGCEQCHGEGVIWNNADPTSGQWVDCDRCAVRRDLARGGGVRSLQAIGHVAGRRQS